MKTFPGGITYIKAPAVERRPHPSGRPIRKNEVKGKSVWRVPDRGPVIPRLRPDDKPVEAIGFMARLTSEDFD